MEIVISITRFMIIMILFTVRSMDVYIRKQRIIMVGILMSMFRGRKRRNAKRSIMCSILLAIILVLNSCGFPDTSDPAANNGNMSGSVPVAEFHDMRLSGTLDYFWKYAVSEDWLYCVSRKRELGAGQRNIWLVYRNGIHNMFEPEIHIEREGGIPLVLLAGSEGDCFLFCQDDNGEFSLEKYDATGEMQWHRGYTASQFQDIGDTLTEGIVTKDGRVFLFAYGEAGKVFAFGAEGGLEEIYVSDLESLEGIAEGRDGKVYGYYVTGESPVFWEVGSEEKPLICPITPLQVFGGCEDGIYLCCGEGLWKYDPITGQTVLMWEWDDEYVQIDGGHVTHIFRGNEEVHLMCLRGSVIIGQGDVLTFVSVDFRDGREYSPKQIVTVSNARNYDSLCHMEDMVRRYNRQSRKYRVVIVTPQEDTVRSDYIETLQLQLIRGEGPDLIDVQGMDVDGLAAKGVFEDLTPYYESIDAEEILEPIREAGKFMGRDMMVIPSFSLETLLSREEIEPKDWTPAYFLELSRKKALFRVPMSQMEAFWYCMGASAIEHFVDYEKKECHFDCEDFYLVLEGCNQWESEETADDLLIRAYINSTNMFLAYKNRNAFWLGNPGWNGAENQFYPTDVFVMNRASENKEGAWDFLAYLLSRDMQDSIDWEFPVREDSLEQFFVSSYIEPGTEFNYQEGYGVLTQEDFGTMRSLIEHAVYRDSALISASSPIRLILYEEVGMYFAGDATLEKTVEKIQNRVSLYLKEL